MDIQADVQRVGAGQNAMINPLLSGGLLMWVT